MRISKKAWRTLATAVAVPGSALGALAGFAAVPAMAAADGAPGDRDVLRVRRGYQRG